MNAPIEDDRILILAPTSADASLTRTVLAEAELRCEIYRDLETLTEALRDGAGALLLTDEVPAASKVHLLIEALEAQPAWSDLPILLLAESGADSSAAAWALEMLGNVTVLERPVRITTLVSALRTAVRARRRQYQLRDQLVELRHGEEALKEADRRKDEFLATLAHELRNPLAPLRNALHIMQLASDDETTIERARSMMERQLLQMVRLIDDLLDVSRITRGKLQIRKQRIDLASVIGSAVDTTRPLIDSLGHVLDVKLPPQPIHLDADPMRLSQVFSNLLSNAAKYMDRGGHIGVTAELDGNDVIVKVRDTGVGIPAAALPTIFDMFIQVDPSLERSQGGLGIGLTLVQRLVQMHGGSVRAFSEGLGKGAEFTTRLPIMARGLATDAPAAESPCPSMPRYRILVVDDNLDAAESTGTMLRMMGNDVRIVHDGLQALDETATFRPDVVLLDIGMPGLNGFDVARRIREQPWGKWTVLVALTGWGQEDDKRKAQEAGFDHHFTKPVDPREIERLLQRAAAS